MGTPLLARWATLLWLVCGCLGTELPKLNPAKLTGCWSSTAAAVMNYQSGEVCVFFEPTFAQGCSAIPSGVHLLFQSRGYDTLLEGWLSNYDYANERSVCLECARPVPAQDGTVSADELKRYKTCKDMVRKTTAAVLTLESIALRATVSINQFTSRNIDLSNCFNSSSFASADSVSNKLCANLALSGNCTMDFMDILFSNGEPEEIEELDDYDGGPPAGLRDIPYAFSYFLQSSGMLVEFRMNLNGIMNALYKRLSERPGDAGGGSGGGGGGGDATNPDGDQSGAQSDDQSEDQASDSSGDPSGDPAGDPADDAAPDHAFPADSFPATVRLGNIQVAPPVTSEAFKTTLIISGDGLFSLCATMKPDSPTASKVELSRPLNDPYSYAYITLDYKYDGEIPSTLRAHLGEIVSASFKRCFDSVWVVPYSNIMQVVMFTSEYADSHPELCNFRGDDQLYKIENSLAFHDSAGKYNFREDFNSSQSISSSNCIINFQCSGEENAFTCSNMGEDIMYGRTDLSGVYMLSLKTVQWSTYRVLKVPIQAFYIGCWTRTRAHLYRDRLCIEMIKVDEEYCGFFEAPQETDIDISVELPSGDDYLNSLVYGSLRHTFPDFWIQTRTICFSQEDFQAAEAGSLRELIRSIRSMPRMRIGIRLKQGSSLLTAGVVGEVLNRDDSTGSIVSAVIFVLVVVGDLVYFFIMGRRLYAASRTLNKTIRRQRKRMRQQAAQGQSAGEEAGNGMGSAVVASAAAV